MTFSPRVLDPEPVASLDAWIHDGGGRGLEAARAVGAPAVLDTLDASGLRGRGGAGFPTGVKWRSVAANASPDEPATVVVNGAEGEPGSFKDRAILAANPYRVLEGGLIAAVTIGADRLVVAVKGAGHPGGDQVRAAAAELTAAGWGGGITIDVLEGPGEYLFGEEKALLEVLEGRPPFPRVTPPWRRGAEELGDGSAGAGGIELAGPGDATPAPPALVNNVETMANVPAIVVEGPEWFRSVGTAESPGTIVCTVTGRTRRHGVAEVPMGTPLREVIDTIGGGPVTGRVVAVLSGVSNPFLPADRLDTPLTYEHMVAAGSGLGAAGFIVYDQSSDLVAATAGVSRFLAVESCGQCTPCKQDGRTIAEHLDRIRRSDAAPEDLATVVDRLGTVADGARCFLATQHQLVVQSGLELFREAVDRHVDGSAEPAGAELVAEIVDLVDERAVVDENHADKQPDWSDAAEDSGQSPADQQE